LLKVPIFCAINMLLDPDCHQLAGRLEKQEPGMLPPRSVVGCRTFGQADLPAPAICVI